MATRIRNLTIGSDNIDTSVVCGKLPESLKYKVGKLYLDGHVLSQHGTSDNLCVSRNAVENLGYTFVTDMAKLVNRGMAYRHIAYDKQGNKLKRDYIQLSMPSKPLKIEDLKDCTDFYIRCDYLLSSLGMKK